MPRERIDYRITHYDRFYTYPSFAMVPELLLKNRKSAFWWIIYGLRLDDAWDYDLDREGLNGTLLDEAGFVKNLPEYSVKRLRLAELKFLRSTRNLPESERALYIQNFERFKQSVSFVESLALAIPYSESNSIYQFTNCYNKQSWPGELLEKYRTLVAIIWGAMYVATVPGSKINLLNTPQYVAEKSPIINPAAILEDYHSAYISHLLSSNSEGQRALSLAYQMTFGQMVTDQNDAKINHGLYSPSFYTPTAAYPENEFRRRQQELLALSRHLDHGRPSITRSAAGLFDILYRACANGPRWRETLEKWDSLNCNRNNGPDPRKRPLPIEKDPRPAG